MEQTFLIQKKITLYLNMVALNNAVAMTRSGEQIEHNNMHNMVKVSFLLIFSLIK